MVIVLGYLALVNGLVLAFNLVPAFPLDGGRVLRSILWGATGNLRRATCWASLLGQAFAWLLIGWGMLEFFTGNWFDGVWIGLIGLFLNSAARSSYQQVLIQQGLARRTGAAVHEPRTDRRAAVAGPAALGRRLCLPLSPQIVPGGVRTGAWRASSPRSRWRTFPATDWGRRTVGEAMKRDVQAVAMRPDADALEALGKMQRTGASRLLVTEGDRLVGIVSLKDLLAFLNEKIELEGLAQ